MDNLAEVTERVRIAKQRAIEAQQVLNANDDLKQAEAEYQRVKTKEDVTRKSNAIHDEISLLLYQNNDDTLAYRDRILQESIQLLASAWIERLKTVDTLRKISDLLYRDIFNKYNAGLLELTEEESAMIKMNLLPLVLKSRLESALVEYKEKLNLNFESEFIYDDNLKNAVDKLTRILKENMVI